MQKLFSKRLLKNLFQKSTSSVLVADGYLQSWKYLNEIQDEIKSFYRKYFKYEKLVTNFIDKLKEN